MPRIRSIPRPPQLRCQPRRTFSTHLARLHRVCEFRRFKQSADEWDQRVYDGVVALACGSAPV